MTSQSEDEIRELVYSTARKIGDIASGIMSDRQKRTSYKDVLANLNAYFYHEGELNDTDRYIVSCSMEALETAFNTPIRWTTKGKDEEVLKAYSSATMLAATAMLQSTNISAE